MSHSIEDFTYIINPILKRFSFYPYEYDELYQIGLIAIDTAIKRFNEAKGIINAYVTKYVLFEIKNYFKSKSSYVLQNDFDNFYHNSDNDYKYLNDEIKKLPNNERMVILYKYFYQLPQSQIASKIGLSQATISRIEKNALLKLRNSLT